MSLLKTLLEQLETEESQLPLGAVPEGRFAEPWRTWSSCWGLIRAHLARAEKHICRELERFLDTVRRHEGAYRAEAELDSEDSAGQLVAFVERLLEEVRTPAET